MTTEIKASLIYELSIDIQEEVGTLSFRDLVTAIINNLNNNEEYPYNIDRVEIARLLRFGK